MLLRSIKMANTTKKKRISSLKLYHVSARGLVKISFVASEVST